MTVELAHFAEAEQWRSFLTAEEREQAARRSNTQVRLRYEIGRGMRRKLLADASVVAPGDLRFVEEQGGKPQVANADGWDFNLSHAGDYVVCAISRGIVGVDIEQVRPAQEMESITNRYFHPDEAAAWRALASSLREEAFFVLWSAREAAMKCAGLGLAKGLSVTRVDPLILGEEEAAARVGEMEMTVRRWQAPQGYVGVVAQGAII